MRRSSGSLLTRFSLARRRRSATPSRVVDGRDAPGFHVRSQGLVARLAEVITTVPDDGSQAIPRRIVEATPSLPVSPFAVSLVLVMAAGVLAQFSDTICLLSLSKRALHYSLAVLLIGLLQPRRKERQVGLEGASSTTARTVALAPWCGGALGGWAAQPRVLHSMHLRHPQVARCYIHTA
jgi:hypothetical protein